MKEINVIRERLAELGFEHTPKQVLSLVKKVAKLQKDLLRCPELEYMDRQELRQLIAETGEEITPDELDCLMEVVCKIKKLSI